MSAEIASLVLSVDSSQAARATDDLVRLAGAGKKTEQQTEKLTDEFTKLTAKLFPVTRTSAELARYQDLLADKLKKGEINAEQYANAMKKVKTKQDEVDASLKRLNGDIDQGSGVWTKFGNIIGGLAIGASVVTGIKAVIQATIESEQAQAQLEARLKSTNGVSGMTIESLNGISAALMKVTTVDDEAIAGVEAMLLTFTRIKADNFAMATEAVLNLSQAMGTDLNSAAVQVGKALNDPVQGVTALRRAGVQLTDQQTEMIKKMMEVGDVSGAQRIVLGELENQMGGAARAARDTLGGALSSLKNNFMNLLEGDSGGDGVRGATKSVNDLADTMNDPQVKEGFGNIVQGIASITGAMVEGISIMANYIAQMKETYNLNQKVASGEKLTSYKDTNARLAQVGERLSQLRQPGVQGMNDQATFGGEDKGYLAHRIDTKEAYSRAAEINYLLQERTKLVRANTEAIKGDQRAVEEAAAKAKAAAEAAAKRDPNAATGPDDEEKSAREKAARQVESARKRQAQEFQIVKDGLRTEEQVIEDSYKKRQEIIDANTKAESDERQTLTARNKEEYEKDLAALQDKQNREVEAIRVSLLTEEERLAESYQKRRQVIIDSMKPGPERDALLAKLEADRQIEKDDLALRAEERRYSIMSQYMTEADMRAEYTKLELDDLKNKLDQKLILEEDYEKAVAAIHKREQDAAMAAMADKMSRTGEMFGALGQLAGEFAKGQGKNAERMFKISKALNTAQAVMSIAAGVAKAQELGYPMNIVESIRVAALGAVQIATINSQQFSGAYDQGGYIPVGKVGIVGEFGPELVRGPAAVTGRELTARRGSGGGGDVNINHSTVINNDGSTSSDSSGDQARDAKKLTDMIDNRVRDVVQREMRQGGIIWKMNNGR